MGAYPREQRPIARLRGGRYRGCVPDLATVPGTDLITTPATAEPSLDGDHERMAHIVLEGVKTDDGEFMSAGPSVVEGMVNGTPVKALCGKVWVPNRDPKKFPLCPTCKEIAEGMGWQVPAN